jgi:purine-nucleoside phosphorylase
MFKIRKETYKFTGRSHSIKGIVSAVTGGVGVVSILVLFILSGVYRGNGSILFGAGGMLLFALTVTGFILGVKACTEKEIYYTAPITGMVTNGILSIMLFILYIMGLFI